MHDIAQGQAILNSSEDKPLLIVVVDTEEEFDWALPPERTNVNVDHVESLHLTHDICQSYGVNPCYVIDYPIATTDKSKNILVDYVKSNQCEIGAHLHPWVNPPFTEELSFQNMYPGNLSYELEHEKLKNLVNAIKANFSIQPKSYKAGRYGFGKNTEDIIQKLGFDVDLSFRPPVNHSDDGGPDYSDFHPCPSFFDNSGLLSLPVTGSFTGLLGRYSKSVYTLADAMKIFKLPAILSRIGILDKLVLTPEGFTSNEHIALTKFLYSKGQRVFTWTYHSSAVIPGNTEYVKTKKQQQDYLDSFKRYFDFFFGELNGLSSTPLQYNKTLKPEK